MTTFVKEGADSIGTAIDGVPVEFEFPYTTEDPKEIEMLQLLGATEQETPKKILPKAQEVKDDATSE